MLKGFRDFILRGNVIELAIAVVIGTAFTAVVSAFTEAIVNPLIAAAGGDDNVGLGFTVISGNPDTFVNIGAVITAIITFLITAAVVYFIFVMPMNKLSERRKKAGSADAAAKIAPPTDLELLTEIRDLLREQAGKSPAPGTTDPGDTATATIVSGQ